MLKKQNISRLCPFIVSIFLTHVMHMRNVCNECYQYALANCTVTKRGRHILTFKAPITTAEKTVRFFFKFFREIVKSQTSMHNTDRCSEHSLHITAV